MKKLALLLLILFEICYAQNAQDYFPALGSTWYSRVQSLDSLNHPIDSTFYFRADSFAVENQFEGKLSKVVLGKIGSSETLEGSPYIDTNYINLEGANASTYFKTILPPEIASLDSSLIRLAKRFEGWYSLYRFNSSVNSSYTILTFDTTIVYDTITLPLRFEVKAKRIADETMSTIYGIIPCKKFVTSNKLSYLISFPPLLIPVPIVEFLDTVYMANNHWIVKSFAPTAKIDLSILNLGIYYINGTLSIACVKPFPFSNNEKISINKFALEQNYPNPFNPATKIAFTLDNGGPVNLIVYNLLGQVVSVPLNGYLSSGSHSIDFNAKNLPSGVYFYKLTNNGNSIIKKMNLLR